MLDPHTHLRDGRQQAKETVAHGLEVAYRAGLDGIFEMPNTDPPLLTRQDVEARLNLADRFLARSGLPIFHGLFVGLTAEPNQIREACILSRELFPRVVGLKLYAGSTTGDLAITENSSQSLVFQTLSACNYQGVLAVHAEAENLITPALFRPEEPATHSLARPVQAELASVEQLCALAAANRFKGTLHICHVSSPATVRLLEEQREITKLKLTCGVTPQHLLLNTSYQQAPHSRQQGLLLKVNPPLRTPEEQAGLLEMLLRGQIDWIETDHAPHTLADKYERYASGLPGFPIYPHLIAWLTKLGCTPEQLAAITHDNITKTFGLTLPHTSRMGDKELAREYPYDPYQFWYKGD